MDKDQRFPNTKMLRLMIVLSWIALIITCTALGLIGFALAVMAETFNNRAGAIIVAFIALIVITTLGWTVGGFLKRRWR